MSTSVRTEWLAEKLGLTPAMAIREAISVRTLLQEELDDGGTILIERTNGDRVRLELTPTVWPPPARKGNRERRRR